MKSLNDLFRDIICLNEIGDASPYRFDDPDGVRSGKSGWSFGQVQFDTQNNSKAIQCLSDCGFSTEEIQGIVNQSIDVRPFNKRLEDHASIIDKYSDAQLQYCLNQAGNFVTNYVLTCEDETAILGIADYINQYGSMGNGAGQYMRALKRSITAKDVLDFKLSSTKYGKEHPSDCIRRYNNLVKVVTEENV